MITKDSIETAYSFLHQKQRIYVHSTLDWQKDDIEIAIASYADEMSQELLDFMIDARLPECPDVEEKWEQIAKAYIPDGIKEFNDFPSASLGWMMYIGMAVAKFWDAEWEIYSKIDDLYAYMRDKRGYDAMDEYICEDVLLLRGVDYTVLEKLVGECASRVYNALRHQNIESGTKDAFNAYVSCLHQLYLFGAAMQLNRIGYYMKKNVITNKSVTMFAVGNANEPIGNGP